MKTRWKPNATVASVVEQNGRFLLVEEHTSDGLKLNNPAGHLDPGESPVDGCVRETLEETTYTFAPAALVGVYLSRQERRSTGTDTTYLRFAFCGTVGDADPTRTLDRGIVRTVWMTEAQIRACPERHRTPLLLRCLDDYLAGKRYPLDLITTDASVFTPERL